MADKHPRIHGKALHRPGSAPLPHSGLRGAYTRVLSGYPSLFWQKKSLSLRRFHPLQQAGRTGLLLPPTIFF